MAEENYVLDVSWADVNKVAADNRDGNLIKRTQQPMRAARDILPVSSNKSGELMARAPATHSFRSRKEYDDYVAEYPEAMKNGDQVWLQSKGLSGNNVYTLYEYNEHLLVEQTKIISGGNVVSNEGTGANAVIWFTTVAPTNRIFVISDLLGPEGAVLAPGQMIVSDYSGRAYFVAAANEETVTVQDYSVRIVGEDGHTPQKGVDYWTEADQESIVQQVIAALGTPVFGTVDADNNIILTGNLAAGVYTLKYEDAEGNVTEIGTVEVGGETLPTAGYVEMTWYDGVKLDKNNGSEGSGTGYCASGHVEIVPGYTYTAKQTMYDGSRYGGINVIYYDATGGFVSSVELWSSDANEHSVVLTPPANAASFRLRVYYGAAYKPGMWPVYFEKTA